MDDLDARLIAALKVDGRAPLRRIADVLGVSDQQIRRVTHISAHRVLHRYRGGPLVWLAPAGVLTTDQIEQLSPPVDTDSAPPTVLRADDYALLEQLAHDGRATHALLASTLGRDESTVRRRIHQLRGNGSLYFDVELDERQLGYTHNTILWLSAAPNRLADVGRSLSGLPEIAYAAAITGNRNIVASLLCTGDNHLYDFITRHIGGLDGVTSVDTAPIISTVKRIGSPPTRTH